MTLVIVKRQGQDVLILADTMIEDANARQIDVVPGRLKVIPIGPCLTVAFAGNADPASVAVRDARRTFHASGREAALEVVRQDSRMGLTDYIVVSHNPDASVSLIRNGASVQVENIVAIGNTEPFREEISREHAAERAESLLRGRLRLQFSDRILTQKYVEEGIGGFPMAVSATPQGHRYVGMTAGYTYKINIIWGQTTEQPWEQVESGDGHYQLTIMTSDRTDVPVVGACLLQARMGYVYSPIERPEPFPVRLLPHNEKWEGKEQEMFDALKKAIEEHVISVDTRLEAG